MEGLLKQRYDLSAQQRENQAAQAEKRRKIRENADKAVKANQEAGAKASREPKSSPPSGEDAETLAQPEHKETGGGKEEEEKEQKKTSEDVEKASEGFPEASAEEAPKNRGEGGDGELSEKTDETTKQQESTEG